VTDQPIRLIRARDLAKGVVVLAPCNGADSACVSPAREHDTRGHRTGRTHQVVILDAEVIADGFVSCIVIGDDGEQDSREWPTHEPVRTLAVTPSEETNADA
jgi:hypothetical protein